MLIIGAVGPAGCGKSTFGGRLIEGYGFREYSFAKPLKDLCAAVFGWDRARLDELAYKETPSGHDPIDWEAPQEADPHSASRIFGIAVDQFGLTGFGLNEIEHLFAIFSDITPEWTRRKILQHVGTEGFRTIDPDHWVKKAAAELTRIEATGQLGVVIPDVRFLNEVAQIRALGGYIVRLDRLEFTGTAASAHASEQEWRGLVPDLRFVPSEGVEHVRRAADAAMRLIELGHGRVFRQVADMEAA